MLWTVLPCVPDTLSPRVAMVYKQILQTLNSHGSTVIVLRVYSRNLFILRLSGLEIKFLFFNTYNKGHYANVHQGSCRSQNGIPLGTTLPHFDVNLDFGMEIACKYMLSPKTPFDKINECFFNIFLL